MAVQDNVTVELVTVEVNDDFRVEVTQLKKVLDYSPEQALQFANDLTNAAREASELISESIAEVMARQTAGPVIDGAVVL